MDAVERMLLTAIAMERYGQEYYGWFAKSISDRKGKALMRGLAEDEKEHEEIMAREYRRECGKAPPKNVDIKVGLKTVSEVFSQQRKDGEKDLIAKILRLGIGIEQKSIDFYSSKSKTAKSANMRKLLAGLADIEKGHKAVLEENLFSMKQEGSWWGYTPILDG
jgi:rubrerythrin